MSVLTSVANNGFKGLSASNDDATGRLAFREFNSEREEREWTITAATKIADRLYEGEPPEHFNLDGASNISPALLAIFHLKKAQEDDKKITEEAQWVWAERLMHQVQDKDGQGEKELKEEIARVKFEQQMQEILKQDDQLLNDIQADESQATDEFSRLKDHSLHIHRPDGMEVLLVKSRDGKGYVDYNGQPVPGITPEQILKAEEEFQRAHPGERVATYPEAQQVIQTLQAYNRLEVDARTAKTNAQEWAAQAGNAEERDKAFKKSHADIDRITQEESHLKALTIDYHAKAIDFSKAPSQGGLSAVYHNATTNDQSLQGNSTLQTKMPDNNEDTDLTKNIQIPGMP